MGHPSCGLGEVFEDAFGEVAFGGVGDEGGDAVSGAEALRDLQGRVENGAGAGAGEEAFLGGEGADGGEGVAVGDHEDFVADGAIEGVGDERDADAFDFVGAGLASLQDRALGFDGDGEDAGILLLEEAGDAGERAAGADAGDEGVDASVELLPEFLSGGVVVELRVGGVVELEGGPNVGVGFGESEGAADGAGHAIGFGGSVDLGAESTHEGAFFFGEAFGDKEDDAVAAVDADEGESDAGVAGGGFGDDGVFVKEAAAFGVEDHAEGGAIFDGSAGVEEFELGEDMGGAGGDDAMELEDRGVADEGGDVVGGAEAGGGAGGGHRTRQCSSGDGGQGKAEDAGRGRSGRY